MTPRVAVVIPVWDAYVGFLGEALASVRDQAVEAEVIVVDNASTEPVAAAEGARVVRSDARLSTGAARNLGLESVTAPLVVFLDADDLMRPGALTTMAASSIKKIAVVVRFGNVAGGKTSDFLTAVKTPMSRSPAIQYLRLTGSHRTSRFACVRDQAAGRSASRS